MPNERARSDEDERGSDRNGRRRDAGALRLTLDEQHRRGARIKVIGVGGGGGNAVNRMVQAGLEGVEFIVANTDVQALQRTARRSRSRSAPSSPRDWAPAPTRTSAAQAALEDTDKIIQALDGADMVFVTTGLGGGTGTGAAPGHREPRDASSAR